MKYICDTCGAVYDEVLGEPKRKIPAGTAFADLPEQYTCPGCGSEREAFDQVKVRKAPAQSKQNDEAGWNKVTTQDMKAISDR